MSIIVGDSVELVEGDKVHVWNKDNTGYLETTFVSYSNRGGIMAKSNSGMVIHYWNYSIEEPEYLLVKLTTDEKNPHKELSSSTYGK